MHKLKIMSYQLRVSLEQKNLQLFPNKQLFSFRGSSRRVSIDCHFHLSARINSRPFSSIHISLCSLFSVYSIENQFYLFKFLP